MIHALSLESHDNHVTFMSMRRMNDKQNDRVSVRIGFLHTANHRSPEQLFTAGCLLLQNSQLPVLDFFDAVDDTYGTDPDGPPSLSLKEVSLSSEHSKIVRC